MIFAREKNTPIALARAADVVLGRDLSGDQESVCLAAREYGLRPRRFTGMPTLFAKRSKR